jgi:hypothetical protein
MTSTMTAPGGGLKEECTMVSICGIRMAFVLAMLSVFALSIGAGGCATRQTGKAQPSGFLGDYSQLTRGGEGEAQLRYINPDVDWKKYRSVLIDTPVVYVDSETTNLIKADQKRLTDKLHDALEAALETNFEIVEEPGPGVLRVRTAITEAQGSKILLNAATGLVPQLRLATMIGSMATGTAVLVGKCSIEAEILDSTTGSRLAAAVDQRAGRKDPHNMLDKWADVESAFKEWAEKMRARLESLRGA